MNDAVLAPALRLPMECVRNCRVLPDREDILRYLPKDIVFVEIGVALGDFTEKVLQQCRIRQFVAIDIFTMHHYPHYWGGMVGEVLGERATEGAAIVPHALAML